MKRLLIYTAALLCAALACQAQPGRTEGNEILIMAGDYPDPSIVRDGDAYYMVHSCFEYVPGLLIYKSKDLVNWEPLACALNKYVGSVYAPDIVKHNGRWYIYFPAVWPGGGTNMVVWADSPGGPWSDPVDLKIGGIDPGHAVDDDGKRYLMMSNGFIVPLSDDGLSVSGTMEKVYDGWKYPAEWDVEGFCLESPKVRKVGKYYYMFSAQGGTAGPPTSHMVSVARAENLYGPWEDSPYNPLIRTWDKSERWWSKGHGTLFDTPDGKWYVVYHAYENGYYTLGRHTLMEQVEMTPDGWFTASKERSSLKPAAGPKDRLFSDDFSTDRIGTHWHFTKGDALGRISYGDRSLTVRAEGTSPSDSSPMVFITGDHAYEIEVEVTCTSGADAGLLLYYDPKLYAGVGLRKGEIVPMLLGYAESFGIQAPENRRVWFRLRNDRHTVSYWYSFDGKSWTKTEKSCETSGYHHNMAGGFMSLRPGIYAAGEGEAVFRNFKYRTLE